MQKLWGKVVGNSPERQFMRICLVMICWLPGRVESPTNSHFLPKIYFVHMTCLTALRPVILFSLNFWRPARTQKHKTEHTYNATFSVPVTVWLPASFWAYTGRGGHGVKQEIEWQTKREHNYLLICNRSYQSITTSNKLQGLFLANTQKM